MNIFALFVALLLSSSLLVSCSGSGQPAVLRQEIDVTLFPDTHEVSGKSIVTIKPHGAAGISFKLAPDSTVTGALVNGKSVQFNLSEVFSRLISPMCPEKNRSPWRSRTIADSMTNRLKI